MGWFSRTQQPFFYHDDAFLTLKMDGSTSLKPVFDLFKIITLPFDELAPGNPYLKKDLSGLLSKAIRSAPGCAQNIQRYVNERAAPRARMLWLINHVLDNGLVDKYLQDKGLVPMPGIDPQQVKESARRYCAQIAYSSHQLTECIHLLTQTQNTPDQYLNAAVEQILRHMDDLTSPAADEFAREEIALWTKSQGITLECTGQGNALFSDADREKLVHAMTSGLQSRLNKIDEYAEGMRTQLKDAGKECRLSAKNKRVAQAFKDLPKHSNEYIAPLLDLALQDDTLNVTFFKGHNMRAIYPAYGGGTAIGAGAYYLNQIIVPAEQIGEVGKPQEPLPVYDPPIEGGFSVLNSHAVISGSVVPLELRWSEELLHRAMDRLFDNGSLPFPKIIAGETNPLRDKFCAALCKDIKTGNLKHGLEAGRLWNSVGADYQSLDGLVSVLNPASPQFNANAFAILAPEVIADVMLKIHQNGIEQALNNTPELAAYVRDELTPLAQKKNKELRITPTRLGKGR